jgi:hypothetical protein
VSGLAGASQGDLNFPWLNKAKILSIRWYLGEWCKDFSMASHLPLLIEAGQEAIQTI